MDEQPSHRAVSPKPARLRRLDGRGLVRQVDSGNVSRGQRAPRVSADAIPAKPAIPSYSSPVSGLKVTIRSPQRVTLFAGSCWSHVLPGGTHPPEADPMHSFPLVRPPASNHLNVAFVGMAVHQYMAKMLRRPAVLMPSQTLGELACRIDLLLLMCSRWARGCLCTTWSSG